MSDTPETIDVVTHAYVTDAAFALWGDVLGAQPLTPGRIVRAGLSLRTVREIDELHAKLAARSRELASLRAKVGMLEKDAERWRETLNHVGGQQDSIGQVFTLRYFRPVGNIMKGSVAQHFTEAIDAAIERTAK